MPELEERLTVLAGGVDWPQAPDLAPRIMARLRTEARPLPRPGWGGRWAIAAAAAALAVAALAAYPPSRDAIASWVNLHVLIKRVNTLPTPSPLPSGTVGQRLGLGVPMTLSEAQGKVAWKIAVPASLGRPDQVYYLAPPEGPSGGEVTLVYVSRPDVQQAGETGVAVLVTEARGQVQEQFFGKMVGPDATIESVSAGGHAGYWIAGSPHLFVFVDESGQFRTETMRLATNTLVIDDAGTVVRIEGELTKQQALEIGGSL